MAPSKKKRAKATSKNSLRNKQIDAFIAAFKQEVQNRVNNLKDGLKNLQKNVSTMYDRELLQLPTALREMNWLSYCALGENKWALEQLALEGADLQEINEVTSEALRTPIRPVQKATKAKQLRGTIEEEDEEEGEMVGAPAPPLRKRSRLEKEALIPESEPKTTKGKQSARKPPVAKKSRPPSSRLTRLNQRASKGRLTTPLVPKGRSTTTTSQGVTPGFTPRFDSSIFKTPGLRVPAPYEPVFSVSANGSPLADSSDVFVILPDGKGQSIRVKASDLTEKDLLRLNPVVLGSMRKLSNQVLRLRK